MNSFSVCKSFLLQELQPFERKQIEKYFATNEEQSVRTLLTIREPTLQETEKETNLFNGIEELLRNKNAARMVDVNNIPTLKYNEKIKTNNIKLPTEIQNNIILWSGDVTQLNADAIVNAANNQLLGCFDPTHKCVDNVIHWHAGTKTS